MWERSNKSVNMIKQFSVELIKQKLFNKEKEDIDDEIGVMTIDFLDCKILIIFSSGRIYN